MLIAGKGHEQGQDVQGVVHPFSDADELADALRERLGGRDAGGRAAAGGIGDDPADPDRARRATGLDAPDGAAADHRHARSSSTRRKVRPGTLFVALRGEHVDGHDFAGAAAAAGAVAVLGTRPAGGLPVLRCPDTPGDTAVLDALAAHRPPVGDGVGRPGAGRG